MVIFANGTHAVSKNDHGEDINMSVKYQTLHKRNPALHRKIFALAHQIGLDTDKNSSLYDIIESVSGTRSISRLSDKQASSVIMLLERHIPQHKQKITSLRQPGQMRLLSWLSECFLVNNLSYPHDIADKLAVRMLKKPIAKLTSRQVKLIVEAMKSILTRHNIDHTTGRPFEDVF